VSNLIYLGLAAVVTAVGCSILLIRQHKPTGVDHGIDAFRRELDALAPDRNPSDLRDPRRDQDGSSG